MKKCLIASLLGFGLISAASAEPIVIEQKSISVPMETSPNTSAFYVGVQVAGLNEEQFLVDTGSSHTVINEDSLTELKKQGLATYVKDLTGYMADNSRRVVPVYRIKYLNIGGKCMLNNVEVAIFPGKVRQILGLNALGKAAPFRFSMDPPALDLQRCENNGQVVADARAQY